jgi:hypothetical protein
LKKNTKFKSNIPTTKPKNIHQIAKLNDAEKADVENLWILKLSSPHSKPFQ